MTRTVILYKPIVGKVINHSGKCWRIVEVSGDYSCLQGGRNKYDARLELVAPRVLTFKEIAELTPPIVV